MGEISLYVFLVLSLCVFFGLLLLLFVVVVLIVKVLSDLLYLIDPEIINTVKIALTFILVLILQLFCTRCSVKTTERLVREFRWRFFHFPLVVLQLELISSQPFDVVQFGMVWYVIWSKEIFISLVILSHVGKNESQCLWKGRRIVIVKSLDYFILLNKVNNSLSILRRKRSWIPCPCWNTGFRRLFLIFWCVTLHISKKYKLIIIKHYISLYKDKENYQYKEWCSDNGRKISGISSFRIRKLHKIL